MEQLSSLDAQFLGVESARTFGHVGMLAVYDPATAPGGRLEIGDLCRLVSERAPLLPPLRRRLVDVPFGLDLPYWIDDPDFDLDFHIRESAVPPPGDDHRLAETVARIFARPLDRSRPLWELYLIHGLPEGKLGLLTKVHHAAADGISGNEILTTLLDTIPAGRDASEFGDAAAAANGGTDGRVPGQLDMLARGLRGVPRHPIRAAKVLPRLPNVLAVPGANALPLVPRLSRGLARLQGVRRTPETESLLEVTSARPPRTVFNGPISAHRRFAFGSLPLGRVKAIRRAAGTTLNDVVVALCAAAVRDWLLARDALPDDPLVAMVPVSVRRSAERGVFGNRISAMTVPIPTDEPDPAGRLARAASLLLGAKRIHHALPATLLTDATNFIPPAVVSLAARTTVDVLSRTRPPVNLVISNVPGPRQPLYLAGAELVAAYPVSVIVDGVGLNITALSYRDDIHFGIIADRDQMDDVWSLVDGLHSALDDLEQALGTA
jgi:diacylglycerol O-acyltransferase / wax synthase